MTKLSKAEALARLDDTSKNVIEYELDSGFSRKTV